MQDSDYLTVVGGTIVARPGTTGIIPSDFTVNGNVYVAPASYISNFASLPASLDLSACSVTATGGTTSQALADLGSAYHVLANPMPNVMAGKVPGIVLNDTQKDIAQTRQPDRV